MSVTGAPAYEGALHREARRGVKTVTFEVPGGRRDEAPIISQRLLSAKFRGKDGVKQAADKRKFAGFDRCRAGNVEDHRVSAKPSFGHAKAVLAHSL
jgi:hypothetical protein